MKHFHHIQTTFVKSGSLIILAARNGQIFTNGVVIRIPFARHVLMRKIMDRKPGKVMKYNEFFHGSNWCYGVRLGPEWTETDTQYNNNDYFHMIL